MRFTQGQVRGLNSVSVDEFKTWRKVIPTLASHKGHGPTFTPGDVVVVAIVAELVRDFGVRIGTVADQFDELFKVCHGRSWLSLKSCIVLVEAVGIHLVDADSPHRGAPKATMIAVPCAPIVARLQSALASTEAEASQGYLHFPPTPISAAPERRDKRA